MKGPYYDIPLLHAGFFAFVGPNQRVKDFLYGVLRQDAYEGICRDLDECGGMCIVFDDGKAVHQLLWVPEPDNEFVLFHEALHCAFYILDRRGINASARDQEMICYLQEEIVRGFRKVVSKFKYQDKTAPFRSSDLPGASAQCTVVRSHALKGGR